MDRDDNVYTTSTGHSRSLNDYLASGQVLVGCEGNEWILPYVIRQCGARAFSYASDYSHEVDLVAAKQMIHETVERPDLTYAEKAAVLAFKPLKRLKSSNSSKRQSRARDEPPPAFFIVGAKRGRSAT